MRFQSQVGKWFRQKISDQALSRPPAALPQLTLVIVIAVVISWSLKRIGIHLICFSLSLRQQHATAISSSANAICNLFVRRREGQKHTHGDSDCLPYENRPPQLGDIADQSFEGDAN